jgi:hypothetical protein
VASGQNPAGLLSAPRFVVFDISHNRCRLIASIKYRWKMVYIRGILGHAEYDEKVAEMTISVSEKYALEVRSPSPIASERQHGEYLSVLDQLLSKGNPTREEEKYPKFW